MWRKPKIAYSGNIWMGYQFERRIKAVVWVKQIFIEFEAIHKVY
jgi:hypothetical protein